MVKDKIKNALEDAVNYYNGGLSANEAIVKSASEHDLTADQTDRVVESFNTAKTINYFDKNASDRTGSFDLASKKDVTLALYGSGNVEKKASAKVSAPDALSSLFYSSNPDSTANRKNVFAEKRASFLDFLSSAAEERWAHGYSDKTIQDMASDAFSTIKSAEDDISGAIGTLDNYILDTVTKMAKDLSSGAYDIPEDRANLFKVACPHSDIVNELSEMVPMLKKASGGDYRRQAVVDTTSIDDLLKCADDLAEARMLRSEYCHKKEEFSKKAANLKKAMFNDPSMADKIQRSSRPESMLHFPAKSVKQASGVDSYIPGGEDIVNAIAKQKSRRDENEALRDETRGAILADLLSSDPILQDADPRQVASVYKSMITSSPRISLNKEIVRSVLRSAINSIALSPSDAKVLTDVDRGVNMAFGGLKPQSFDD